MWVKNDAANPTHSFKDRVVSVALAKAQELGYQVVACASTGNLANAVAAHAAAAGLESYVFIPADLEEQKILATGVYGTNVVAVKGNYDDVNRLCMELAGRARLGVREREHAALLRRGLARRSRSRSPSSWASSCRTGSSCPIASGSLFTKIARGFDEWREVGLLDGDLPAFNGAQAAGLLARGRGVGGRPRLLQAGAPGHDRQVAGHRQPRRRAVRAGPGAAVGRRRSTRSPTTRSATGIKLLAETTGVFTETAGGVTTATLRKLAERGDIDPTSAWCW